VRVEDLENLLFEAAQRYAQRKQGLCYRSYLFGGNPYFKNTGGAGGRFNKPGQFLVYTSLRARTSLAEATEGSKMRGFPPERKFPQETHDFRCAVEAPAFQAWGGNGAIFFPFLSDFSRFFGFVYQFPCGIL